MNTLENANTRIVACLIQTPSWYHQYANAARFQKIFHFRKYNGWPTCMCIKKTTKNKPAITTTLIYSQCLLIPTQNSPICIPYFANLWGATYWHTVLQDGMATTPYRHPFVEMEGTPPPSSANNRHTIIPAHRSNSCVSADCTLSLAHDQETTWKKATQTSPGCGVT